MCVTSPSVNALWLLTTLVLQRAPEGFTLGHFGFFDATDGQKIIKK